MIESAKDSGHYLLSAAARGRNADDQSETGL